MKQDLEPVLNMENATLNWFFNQLKGDNQCFLYNGNFSDSITSKVIQLNEFNLNNQEEKLKIKKRVSYLMGECFQNIIRHGDNAGDIKNITRDPGFFMTRSANARYYITSGNLIRNSNIDNLKNQIDQVNNLGSDELKALYKHVMKTGTISEKGGAGLGLIDMARKSGQKLRYLFTKYNADSSIFYNQVELESEIENKVDTNEHFNISQAIDFHNRMIKSDILILHKGDCSKKSIIPVLKIIENNLNIEYSNAPILKELYHVLVELLQNVSRHGYSKNEFKQGIFLVSKEYDKYNVSTGNFIENNKVKVFKSHLDSLNKMNRKELQSLYLHQLQHGDETLEGGAGIGLIDIARLLNGTIDYEFTRTHENLSFFTINVTLISE